MSKRIGREYQHLEDFIIEEGAHGVIAVLEEIQELITNPSTLDFKWDGSGSIYWGRNDKGEFILSPKTQWVKGIRLNKNGLIDELLHTGRRRNNQNEDEFLQFRIQFADTYAKLWDILERNTPDDFRGYLNGEIIFSEKLDSSLSVTPNVITFKFDESAFNGRIQTAEVFVVVHGKFDEFGTKTIGNIYPVEDFIIEYWNTTDELIVLNTQHPTLDSISFNIHGLPVDTAIEYAYIDYVKMISDNIDKISNFSEKGFTTLKQLLYRFSVATRNQKGDIKFKDWMNSIQLSVNKRIKILELHNTKPWAMFWIVYNLLRNIKLNIYDYILHNDNTLQELGIRQYIGNEIAYEGVVKEMKDGRIIKIISPDFKILTDKERFG